MLYNEEKDIKGKPKGQESREKPSMWPAEDIQLKLNVFFKRIIFNKSLLSLIYDSANVLVLMFCVSLVLRGYGCIRFSRIIRLGYWNK